MGREDRRGAGTAPAVAARSSRRRLDPLGRGLFPLAHRMPRPGWWLRRPEAEAAAVTVFCGGRILVVETCEPAGVDLPGAGSAVASGQRRLRRELTEETEIRVDPERLGPLGVVRLQEEGRSVVAHGFGLRRNEGPPLEVEGREIFAAHGLTPEEAGAGDPVPGLLLWRAGAVVPPG